MKRLLTGLVSVLLLGFANAWAEEGHEHGHAEHAQGAMAGHSEMGEQTLTGEVVDVFCYLSHGEKGLGQDHAKCAKKCIQQGLPVALKVGDQLYLASMADHLSANGALADLAGQQITVHGKVMERDGQRLISVTRVEPIS